MGTADPSQVTATGAGDGAVPVQPHPVLTPAEVIHVASVHQYDAAERIMKTVPGSGGVSLRASQVEGRYALSWAQNIWADMLAV